MFWNVKWSTVNSGIEDASKKCVAASLSCSEAVLSKAQCDSELKFVCEVLDCDVKECEKMTNVFHRSAIPQPPLITARP
jgi:hypothetical protein